MPRLRRPHEQSSSPRVVVLTHMSLGAFIKQIVTIPIRRHLSATGSLRQPPQPQIDRSCRGTEMLLLPCPSHLTELAQRGGGGHAAPAEIRHSIGDSRQLPWAGTNVPACAHMVQYRKCTCACKYSNRIRTSGSVIQCLQHPSPRICRSMPPGRLLICSVSKTTIRTRICIPFVACRAKNLMLFEPSVRSPIFLPSYPFSNCIFIHLVGFRI